jgi:hypothetical protein
MAEPGVRSEPVTLDRRLLLLVLVPIGVYMLMDRVILPVTFPDNVTFAIIEADSFASVAAAEARYRSFWVTAFLLSAAASITVAVGTALGLWRLRLASDRELILSLILAVVLASVAFEAVGNRWYDNLGQACQPRPASQEAATIEAASGDEAARHETSGETCTDLGGLFRIVFQALPRDLNEVATLHLLDTGLNVVKTLGIVALSLVGAGLILTLAEPQRQQTPAERAARLGRDLQRQKALLQQGAAVYVLAIIAMLAWMHWPLPYLASNDVRGDYRDLLVANALVQGTAYSLGIAAIYLPAAMLLRRRIADLAENAPDATPSWLREQGLEAQPFDQLRQMATVLLPAIIGILPALEKLWSG